MAVTNYERVGRAVELLRDGLQPFVEREMHAEFGDDAELRASQIVDEQRADPRRSFSQWDAAALLRLMSDGWNQVFRKTLGPAERSLVSELRKARKDWAHQGTFSTDDTYRALDSAERLLTAVSAAEQVAELGKMKLELLRLRFDEQVRGQLRRTAIIESPAGGTATP